MIECLQVIRELGLDPTVSRQIHANRLRRLAREGEQYSPHFLARFDEQRRYALPDVRHDADKVRITPLEAEIPEGVEELARKAYAEVRPIKITQLLVEIDQVKHFSRHCTHLHRGDPVRDHEALFASMLAEATNLGLSKMAEATPGMTKDRMSWVSDWYLRDECYSKMLAEIVNYHHRHPFSTFKYSTQPHKQGSWARSGRSSLSPSRSSTNHASRTTVG